MAILPKQIRPQSFTICWRTGMKKYLTPRMPSTYNDGNALFHMMFNPPTNLWEICMPLLDLMVAKHHLCSPQIATSQIPSSSGEAQAWLYWEVYNWWSQYPEALWLKSFLVMSWTSSSYVTCFSRSGEPWGSIPDWEECESVGVLTENPMT